MSEEDIGYSFTTDLFRKNEISVGLGAGGRQVTTDLPKAGYPILRIPKAGFHWTRDRMSEENN